MLPKKWHGQCLRNIIHLLTNKILTNKVITNSVITFLCFVLQLSLATFMRCHLMRFNLVIIVLNLLLKWHSVAMVAAVCLKTCCRRQKMA